MRQQSMRWAVTGTLGIVLALALTVMVNWVAARRWVQGDWTSSRVYSLSAKTLGILSELSQDIDVVVFMTPGSAFYEQVSVLLGRYEAASSHLHVDFIDPDREPLKTRQLAEQYGVSVADTVVFQYGDRSKYVTADQMAEFDYSGMQMGGAPRLQAFKGEEQFTAAILSLVAPEVPRVYFVTGHGEASVGGGGGVAERSVAGFAEALKRENMEVADTALLGGEVPEDADALLVIGPTQAFTADELEVLGSWLDGGGRLLVAIDPLIDPTAEMRHIRLEDLLSEYGVEVSDDLVVDPSRRLAFHDLSSVYLEDFTPHPVTTGLEGVAVLFPITRSVLPVDNADAWQVTTLVETTTDGWGETNLGQLLRGEAVAADDTDTPGPVSVAVAVTARSGSPSAGQEGDTNPGSEAPEDEAGPRLVVVGDSDFLTDGWIANAGNQTLATNAVSWLVARDESLGIPPRQVEQVSLFLSRDQLNLVFAVAMLLMPAAAILAGVIVWRRRRH